jgi:hypothetical protein
MIDALIKRVSVTYECYEMYPHRGKKVQLFCRLLTANLHGSLSVINAD